MAKLWIEIADRLMDDGGGHVVPVMPEPCGRQTVTFTTATQSADFGGNFIRFIADANCHIEWGADPTANANSPRFAAENEYFRWVRPGDKLSVYDGTS